MVIIPGSFYIAFDLEIIGHANNTIVNNVGRNLVKELTDLYGGEKLQDSQRYDLYKTYSDLFLKLEIRRDRIRQGISNINLRRLRTCAGNGDTSKTDNERLKGIDGTKYCIPMFSTRVSSQIAVTCNGEYRRHVIRAQPSFYDVEVDGEYVENKWCHLFYAQTYRPTHRSR